MTVELWNADIDKLQRNDHPVTFMRRLRTKIYAGVVSFSYVDISTLEFDIDHPRTNTLQRWWQSVSGDIQHAVAPAKNELHLNLAEMRLQMNLPAQRADKAPLKFWNDVEIVNFNGGEAPYRACSAARCHKKVDPVVAGGWLCPKCSKQAEEFVWRYSLKLIVRDATQELEVTAFDEVIQEP